MIFVSGAILIFLLETLWAFMDSISTNFGAAAGVNWVVGHSSLVPPSPSIRFGPQKVKGKFHVTGAFQNGLEASVGNAGLGGKSSGTTTASVDDAKELQEEHDPEGHGAGTPPVATPPPSLYRTLPLYCGGHCILYRKHRVWG